ncbi:hypothetical protein HDU98_003926 [Podochytrium sp. JEL0797]|nr:hypothetical protein HDU98_003926 [Podochytrium sp. JEL0797]
MRYTAFESTENSGTAESITQHGWGITLSTPSIADHHMGNATYIHPTAAITPPQIEAAIDSVLDLRTNLPAATLCFQIICSITYPVEDQASLEAWKSALVARGFEFEETKAMLMKWSATPKNLERIKQFVKGPCRVLESIEEVLTADGGSSAYSGQEWLRKVRERQLAKGPGYGCFMASLDPGMNQPVAIASVHVMQGTVAPKCAAVNWCATNSEFRRKGHAANALARALEYVVKECGCEEVYLTAVDEGPEVLYKRMGFVVEEDAWEWQFVKPAALMAVNQ